MANNYYEQIANWRAERHQRESQQRVSELAQEYNVNVRERDDALRNNDIETAEFYDREAEQLEREYAKLAGPQIPQETQEWLVRNSEFFQKYGNNAVKAVGMAHAFAVAPRDPSTTANRQSGMGLTPNTPEYFEAIETLLEMYGKDPRVGGVAYNPDETLTPEEARDIASEKMPLSTNEYNRAVQEMHQTGRDSATQYGKLWNRSAG